MERIAVHPDHSPDSLDLSAKLARARAALIELGVARETLGSGLAETAEQQARLQPFHEAVQSTQDALDLESHTDTELESAYVRMRHAKLASKAAAEIVDHSVSGHHSTPDYIQKKARWSAEHELSLRLLAGMRHNAEVAARQVGVSESGAREAGLKRIIALRDRYFPGSLLD